MKGKELKVVEYNLTFGSSARIVNVESIFKYKKNNNLYIIYSDTPNSYNIIYFGSSHIKANSVLSMECKDKKDEEIIKEYIYKVTNEEELTDYEIISLDKIEEIEIISSNKLELKKETIDKLIELTIPKKEEQASNKNKTKKKNPLKTFLVLVILISLAMGGYYIYTNYLNKQEISKQITCTKTYNHETLKAKVEEEQVFSFDINDNLEKIDITKLYRFNSEEEYYDFINTGTYYKYMKDENTEGGWDKIDEELTFKTTEINRVDIGYKKPTYYEEVLSYYKNDNYTCNEKVID